MLRSQRSTGLADTRLDQTPERQQLLRREAGMHRKLNQLSIIELTLTAIGLNENLMKLSREIVE
jgi:hypothetical protein